MKATIPFFAATLFAGAAFAATIDEVRTAYDTDAFSNATERWRSITADRIRECSRYGRNDELRLNVLIARYEAIGEALAAGDENGAMAATETLAQTVYQNPRFQTCWRRIAKKGGVSREFSLMLRDMR